MSKREHKRLILDFERMDDAKAKIVNLRLQEHIVRTQSHRIVIFCLEDVPRSDPILRDIREWIDEGERKDEQECEDTATFLAKVCRVCESKDGVRACGRCQKVYYCSKDCQVSDWKRHKRTCKCESKDLIYCVAGTGENAAFFPGYDLDNLKSKGYL